MDILISLSSYIKKSTNLCYEKDKSISLTTENTGSTLFSSKEFYSLKIGFDYVNLIQIERLIIQTYNDESYELIPSATGISPSEIILNDSQNDESLVPGIYAIEIHLKNSSIYEYFFEIVEHHTIENSLNTLRNNINEHAHGLAINPSMSGQSILSVLDEMDHLLLLLEKRWNNALGQIELIKRNPVQTLCRTHILRNELVRIDPYVIRYRDKHVGSRKVLQPRLYTHYENADNYALLNSLGIFITKTQNLTQIINNKLTTSINEMARLNELKKIQIQDKERMDKYNFDIFERRTSANAVHYTNLCIMQEVSRLKHIRKQKELLQKLRNNVCQEKSLLENSFNIRECSYKRDVPITSVLYKNCIEILSKSFDIYDLVDVEPHKGFNYKRSEILFEYLGLLKVFRILMDLNYTPGEELKSIVEDYAIPSGSRFNFYNEDTSILILYDSEALTSYDPDTYTGLISENSISRRPDITIECFKKGKLIGIIIIEAKYRKVTYLHSNIRDSKGKFHKTEVEQTMSDYLSLKYYVPDAKEKDVDAVIIYYPKQEKTVPLDWGKDFGILKKYGYFVMTDIKSKFDDIDDFYTLVKTQLEKIYTQKP
jgi:hypothetical protein